MWEFEGFETSIFDGLGALKMFIPGQVLVRERISEESSKGRRDVQRGSCYRNQQNNS